MGISPIKDATTVTAIEVEHDDRGSKAFPTDLSNMMFSQTLTVVPNESDSQLGAPLVNEPNELELSIPREIISTRLASIKFQSELMRPIIAGTYNGKPAFLVQLQLFMQVPGDGHDWINRLQNASIGVSLDDKPYARAKVEGRQLPGSEQSPPAIVKVFPGPDGWDGTVSTGSKTKTQGLELKGGPPGISAAVSQERSRTVEQSGAVRVTTLRTGRKRNNLVISVAEDCIQGGGIPHYLAVPFIIAHHSRRFSMRVTVHATFGFWRGTLARTIPILGRADEPLYFDPAVLNELMETERLGIDGIRVVKWGGELKDVELHEYSSMKKSMG